MIDEVRAAVNTIKEGKAAGEVGIVVEMIEGTGKFGTRKITDVAKQDFFNSGYVPETMRKSVLISLSCASKEVRCSRMLFAQNYWLYKSTWQGIFKSSYDKVERGNQRKSFRGTV